MAKVLRLSDIARSRRPVYFNQQELRDLLDVYSRRVMTGEWRDYAIDHNPGMAVFSIFRNTRDVPIFRLAKLAGRGDAPNEYVLVSGYQKLKSASTIREALSVLAKPRRLELVG
ncbi:MAG: DUF2794 domain-containing protein [Alphaproteobacteria bacterium]